MVCGHPGSLFLDFGRFISFSMLFKINGGEIRFYTFIGLGMGWGLYSLIIGGMLVKLLVKVYRNPSNMGIILWPFRTVSRGIKWLAKKLKWMKT
jgi:hypothetical protein